MVSERTVNNQNRHSVRASYLFLFLLLVVSSLVLFGRIGKIIAESSCGAPELRSETCSASENIDWQGKCTSDDKANCCGISCVDPLNRICYPGKSYQKLESFYKDRFVLCDDVGRWRDSDTGQWHCNSTDDTAGLIGNCPNDNCWIKAGEAEVGEYPDQITAQCCGDDVWNERYSGGTDGTWACCDGKDVQGNMIGLKECVLNGKCQDRQVTEEICNNKRDDDCDGETNESPCREKVILNVILLSWDGAQRNHLNELLDAGKLPHLQELINEGRKREMSIFTENCGCANDGDNYHTETGPGHTAMLTGYGFPETKNHANKKEGQGGNKNCPEYCPKGSPETCIEQLGPNPLPKGYSIFERIKAFDPEIKTGLITGKNLSFFPFPALKHAAPPSCCGGGVCGDGNAIDTCLPRSQEPILTTPRFLLFIEGNKDSQFFLFAHYKYPDAVGHVSGENSIEYSNAIIEDDTETGKMIQKLKDLGIYDKTVVLVTTDHGFVEGWTGHHPCVPETKDIWIVSNHKNVINRQGVTAKQTSVVPTIFDIFGMNKNVNPPFAGQSLFAP